MSLRAQMFQLTLAAAFITFLPMAPVQASGEMATLAPWTAHILRQSEVPKLEGLTFPDKKLVVRLIPKSDELRPLVELKGNFNRPGWTLLVYGQRPMTSANNPNDFSVFAYLNSQVNEVTFEAKGPDGKIESETLYLFAPEAQEFQVVSTWESIVLSAGVASFMYEQSFFGRFRSSSGFLRLNYDSPEASSHWGTLAQGQITVLNFASSPIQANPQVVDAHAALSYRLGWGEEGRYRHRIFVGADYSAVYSNGSPFGFAGLMAPEIGWATRYYEDSRNTYMGEFRWVLFGDSSLGDQRALHAGLTWIQTLKSLRRRNLGFSIYDSSFVSDGQKIRVNLVSIQLGFSI